VSEIHVSQLPLQRLVRGGHSFGPPKRSLFHEDIRAILREGTVEFVVAEIGHPLHWVPPAECFRFWKTEVEPHLAESAGADLGQFPGSYCYFAVDWGPNRDGIRIVVLERAH